MIPALYVLVRQRARHACEYCTLPESLAPVVPHHVEHIIARKHGGPSIRSNLALACHHCNLHKGTDLVGIDPTTKKRVPLFNPRKHVWRSHFLWNGVFLVGKTAIGRTSVRLLAMNDEDMLRLRRFLLSEGKFPW